MSDPNHRLGLGMNLGVVEVGQRAVFKWSKCRGRTGMAVERPDQPPAEPARDGVVQQRALPVKELPGRCVHIDS